MDGYDGSLESLVEKVIDGSIDIFNISLYELVSSYVNYLNTADGMVDLEEASEFLMLSALLIELKSSKLLPDPDPVNIEEELEDLSERDLLVSRLLRCRAYAAAGRKFALMISHASLSVPHPASPNDASVDFKPNLLETVTAESLQEIMYLLLTKQAPQRVDMSHVGVDSIRVSDVIASLVNTLPYLGSTPFRHLVCQMHDRLGIIAHFLALLELARVGTVVLEQRSYSDELYVTWIGMSGNMQSLEVNFSDTRNV